ncbi:hypothetical protein N7455_001740 [Penicillium solitum]|uniref:uncharacterized protein n=1 Tax=Penicillium solitum TaxID=60172 RepID=UPI0032C4543D|nr:hypothetical protein N7536_005765 [Penicillium majusculum]KAJ5878275.1 hypothetical protein N7455_001740 [Penicillium solitum]
MFDRPMNLWDFFKVDAIKEAQSEGSVGVSRHKTEASKVVFVEILANPHKNFLWKSQKRYLGRVQELWV